MEKIYRSDTRTGSFIGTLLLSGVAMGLYKGIQDNYLAEIVHIGVFERGIVEFFRELPGFLVIFILAWMYRLTENTIFRIGLGLITAGLAGFILAQPGKMAVIALMTLYSSGEHIIMPVRTTISLDLAKRDKGGASLGLTSALGFGGNIAGYILVSIAFVIFAKTGIAKIFQFKSVYGASAVLMAIAVLVSLSMKNSGQKVARRRLYFSRKFSKYYIMELFYGSRKQIFITFAPYVLIIHYHAGTAVISLLLAISALFSALASPLIGKLIDRAGYRLVMIADTSLLIAVCFFYGFSHLIFPGRIAFYVVCANYVLDGILSVASMANNVFARDIALNQEELTATLSTGISVNHIISIFIALWGGLLWQLAGIEYLFLFSAFLALLNTLFATTVRKPAEVN